METNKIDLRNTCDAFIEYLESKGVTAFLIATQDLDNSNMEVSCSLVGPDDKDNFKTIRQALRTTCNRQPTLKELLTGL